MSERIWRPGIVAVLLLAVLTRLSSPSVHFRELVLVPRDGDSAYHLRRVMSFFEHPPWPCTWDAFLGFPQGAPVPWAPGWDAYLALLAWVFGGFSTEGLGFQVGLAMGGMLVGVITCGLAAMLGRHLFGDWAGLAAGVMLALSPMHVAATQFACLDHNPAEGLFLIGMTYEATRERSRWWVIGLLVAGACLAWVGGLLYAGLGMGALCLMGLLREGAPPWETIGGMAFGAVLLAPPAVAMGVAQGTPFTYAWLSGFHPAMVAVLTVGAAWLFALKAWPERRAGVGGVGVVLGLVGGVALAPSVYTGLTEWLLTEDPWLDTVQEMQPFLSNGLLAKKTWQRMVIVLSWAAPVFPLILGWHAWKARRDVRLVPLVAIGAGTTVLLLLQVRFGWTLAPLLAVAVAGVLAALPVRAWMAVPIAFVLNLHSPDVMQSAWVNPKARQTQRPHRFEAYHWLRENTPEVSGEAPEYGVLSTWDHGHWISGVAERPEYIGHFGTYAGGVPRYEATQAMYDGDEDAIVEMMDRDRLRYLVVEGQELEGRRMMPLLFGGSLVATRLRGVFASSLSTQHRAPGAWVYERVEGALLTGFAQETVTAEVMLQVAGHSSPWRTQAVPGPDGAFSLRVPYWNGDAGAVGTAAVTSIYVGLAEVAQVELTEEDVRSGAHYEVLPAEGG